MIAARRQAARHPGDDHATQGARTPGAIGSSLGQYVIQRLMDSLAIIL
jgi:hypothetical protein